MTPTNQITEPTKSEPSNRLDTQKAVKWTSIKDLLKIIHGYCSVYGSEKDVEIDTNINDSNGIALKKALEAFAQKEGLLLQFKKIDTKLERMTLTIEPGKHRKLTDALAKHINERLDALTQKVTDANSYISQLNAAKAPAI